MPVHDWTRVSAGTFHDFHLAWIAELRRTLNGGLLPDDYYALAEQRVSEFEADLLALERRDEIGDDATAYDAGWTDDEGGGVALASAAPKARLIGEVDEASLFAIKRRTLSIRHATGDRIVALIEIASPGNKDRRQSVTGFVDKAVASLQQGHHLVVIDLLPPRPADQEGLPMEVWGAVGGEPLADPSGVPLGLASFRVADGLRCYAEPVAVGTPLPELPLFYHPEWYVTLPLEATYAAAYEGVPKRWRRVIEVAA